MYIARYNNGDYGISREKYKKINYKQYKYGEEDGYTIVKDWEVKRGNAKILDPFEGKRLIGRHIRKGTQIEI